MTNPTDITRTLTESLEAYVAAQDAAKNLSAEIQPETATQAEGTVPTVPLGQ